MNIQIINKQNFVFRVGNNEYQFVKPNSLYKNFGTVIHATAKGSTMGWHIEGMFLSYNKLRALFKNDHRQLK